MPTTTRLELEMSVTEAIAALGGDNYGSLSALMACLMTEPLALSSFLTIDGKHLYDEHIWKVFKHVCGEDPARFLYHVQVELPDQETGELRITGPYSTQIEDTKAFFAKRTFGKPGSYWALEHPPTDRNYEYPIL